MPLFDVLESTAFGAALVFGFRHGFDWDHLAALTDLTGSQTSSRRSMWLATLYATGHAAMVLVLGTAAILFAARVPDAVDVVMERFVGVSLLALGVWILWTALRTRGAPPMRSRWMLVIDGVQRLRPTRAPEPVVIEHDHPHHHDDPLHQHGHEHDTEAVPLAGAAGAAGPVAAASTLTTQHRHPHRHVGVAPRDPFVRYGAWSSFGVGVLHGVGAETPTQVLLFATAAHASDRPTSIGILGCFVVGLVIANTIVAGAGTFGFARVLRHPVVALGLAAVTAAFSLAVGALLLAGAGSVLPTILA